jgi:tetratricopeptide (TPR) repeat protein
MNRTVASLLLVLLVVGCGRDPAQEKNAGQPGQAKTPAKGVTGGSLDQQLAKAQAENKNLKKQLAAQELAKSQAENVKLKKQIADNNDLPLKEEKKTSGSRDGFTSLSDLGKATLKAFQSHDPDKILALYPSREDMSKEKQRLIRIADDPLVELKIEKYFSGTFEQWDKTRESIWKKTDALLRKMSPKEVEIISNCGFVGLAPLQVTDGGLAIPFGLDPDQVRVKRVDSAMLYLQIEGDFYSLELDDLMYVNDRWFLAGDFFSFSGRPLRLTRRENDLQELFVAEHPEARRVYEIIFQRHTSFVIGDTTEVINRNPDDSVAYHKRGQAYSQKREYDQAIADFTQVIQLKGDEAVAYQDRGDVFAIKGQFEKAIVDYTEAMRRKPKDASVHASRGHAYFLLSEKDDGVSEYDQVIADCSAAIRIAPDYSQAYSVRRRAYLRKGQYDKAIADCTEVIRINPDHASSYNTRGFIYYWWLKGEYDKAIADFTRAIELDAGEANWYENRGNVFALQGQLYKALEDYGEAIRINPGYLTAYKNRARVYLTNREYGKVIADCTAALRIRPAYPQALGIRGKAYAGLGENDKAIADFNEALRLDPTDAEVFLARGNAYQKKGDQDKAEADFAQAKKLGLK